MMNSTDPCDIPGINLSLNIGTSPTALRRGDYFSPHNLFLATFHKLPNQVRIYGINCEVANAWFQKEFQTAIHQSCTSSFWERNTKQIEMEEQIFFAFEDLLYHVNAENFEIRLLYVQTPYSKIEEILKGLAQFKFHEPKSRPEISLVIDSGRGLKTKSIAIDKPKFKIEDNYNNDFQEIHRIIFKRLSTKNDKGIVLLHGKPGTGKTSYIRYLIGRVKKRVIFLPPNMAMALTNPDMITLLMENQNSILVIEDAENIIIDRERNENSRVSTLLNVSDGLLSDCLNIQIICSFNTDLSRIDNALLRKGRLIAKYEFKELAKEKAQTLSKALGYTTIIQKPMTLSEIYNQKDAAYPHTKTRNPIGFQALTH